jgi:peptidyl-prolyl cis-trans isomerase SurA
MNHHLTHLSLVVLLLTTSLSAQAQGLQLAPSPTLAFVGRAVETTQADYIVAIVNAEPITNNEVRREIQRVLQQMTQQRRAQPDVRLLVSEVLDGMINLKVQLQLARESGVRIEDSAIELAEQNIAQQNQIDLIELRRRVERDGMTQVQFRSQLRDQLLLQRLRERDVDARVRITDQDIDQYLQEQENNQNLDAIQLNLSQVMVAVPEAATPAQIEALRKRAERALERARAGEDFAALVREFSDAADLANGGQMGLREASRYPALFSAATLQLGVGDVAALVRSPAGFHVLKVTEKLNTNLPTAAVTQSRARHILLVPNPRTSELQARDKLAELKKRVVNGQADFPDLAREYSQDGSAAQGGDLGWASPGMFVPEFEAVMNRLVPGEVSDPLVSRFGVHLIQLLERRKATLTQEQQRESVRAMLREKKLEESYATWVREQRGRAFVELREPPL